MDSGATQGPGCSCDAEQGGEDMIEKTSKIELQYDETDADKLVDFGAKLNTNSKGEHRLVEVKEGSLAQQLELKNDDVIIELNGADVTDVFHAALVLSLRDLGTKVQFIVNRLQEGSLYQAAVYFRLGPSGEGGSVARIEYNNDIIFVKFGDNTEEGETGGEQCVSSYFVFIERPNVPGESAARLIDKYTLDTSKRIHLQLTKTKDGATYDLNIQKPRAEFTGSDGKAVKI